MPDSKARYLAGVVAIVVSLLSLFGCTLEMPEKSFSGDLPPLTDEEKHLSKELEKLVEMLAGKIGERNLENYEQLEAAAAYLENELENMGWTVKRQSFKVLGKSVRNIEVELEGKKHPDEIVVIGGHYDSVALHHGTSPGANDNGTGAAAVVSLASRFVDKTPDKTVRFVLFVNEEPPYFQTANMGSRQYAKRCRERKENIIAMLSLETIGYYSDRKGSQKYPAPFNMFYPDTGNFVGFVGNSGSSRLVKQVVSAFRKTTKFPSEGIAAPEWLEGIGWSDQESFWKYGYQGVMVTDTAPFRYPHYHSTQDTPDKVDYDRTARVVQGICRVVSRLSQSDQED